ncbi:MAG: hypothetical protein HOK72_07555 [Flavobacteriales bacterium]|nr:hypothetical protein [Flavobacteriales bacterium]
MASRDRTKNRSEIKFKSAGQLKSVVDKAKRDFQFQKLIGIKTPLELGSDRDGLFKMHKNLKDQIKDNFKNLLMTNKGERLGNYNFGANLEELAFELASDDIESEAISRINQAISVYMPFISLTSFEAFTDRDDNEHHANIGVRVLYAIPSLNVSNESIEVIIRAVG